MSSPAIRRKSVFSHAWDDIRDALAIIFSDVFLFIALAISLLIVFQAFQLMQKAGLPATETEIFQRLHHWAFVTVELLFVTDLIWRLVIALFVRKRSPA